MLKRDAELRKDEEDLSASKKRRIGHETDQTSPTENKKLTHDDYTVGWICPLEVEQIASLEMLDEEHERLPQADTDHNVYNLGSIAGHNVVVAGLHQAGNNPAATVVTQMRMTFRNLKFGLLVGIGGGVPVKTDNGMIRLGDIVVSKPVGEHSGAVQYDHGKATVGEFERTGVLAPPPAVLLNAAQDLAAKRARSRIDPVEENVKRIDTSIRGLRKYKHPGVAKDYLYKTEYIHQQPGLSCDQCGCDQSMRIQRSTDDDDDGSYIVVHRGTIASGEAVIKDAMLRDKLANKYGLLCFEMEAAGALADFPCMVVRGISDYCDSHKNDQWHGYAAAVAAAYSRQLFFHMPIDQVQRYISKTAEKTIDAMDHRQRNQYSQKILEWLSPTDFPIQQQDIIRRRQDGTAQWFLDSPEFQDWLGGPKKTLYCPGMPGAGKTMMAAIAIDFLEENSHSDEIGIAFLFCSYNAKVDQSAANLYAAILKQLAQSRPSIAKAVESLYRQHTKRGTRPSLDDVFSTLQHVLAFYSDVYIIVDALDECESDSRREFLARIQRLSVQAGGNIHLLATSRLIPEVEYEFREALTLQIQASREDVKRFIAGQIHRLPACIQDNPTLQDLVQEKIIEAANGMFLLARLYTDSLLDKRTVKAVKSTLVKFEKGSAALDSAYEDALLRIDGQLDDDRKLAKKVLSWITLSRRPLTTAEICCALAVELGDTELDQEAIPKVEDLVNVCAGLVVIDEKGAVIRPIHYTTQEYFERYIDTWNPTARLVVASTCLTYLSFSEFKSSCATFEDYRKRLRQNKFLVYAANNWGQHARIVEDEVCDLACSFLIDSGSMCSITQAMKQESYRDFHAYSPMGNTGLHMAAQFGLVKISGKCLPRLEKETTVVINQMNDWSETPLYIAASHGHHEMVQFLLNAGADINARGSYRNTPLHAASFEGHEEVLKLLLDESAGITSPIWSHQCKALYVASERGNKAIVKLLLNATANAHTLARDPEGSRALYVASEKGYEAIVKLLLDAGANVHAHREGSFSALSIASFNGHEAVVKLLLNAGVRADTSGRNLDESKALFVASEKGYEPVVKLLLDAGADVDAYREGSHSILSMASFNGHKAVVKLLLNAGANMNAESSIDALYVASQGGHKEVVEVLLKAGAGVNPPGIKRDEPHSALLIASFNGYAAVVKLLIEAGADVNAHREGSQSALSIAAFNGHAKVVKLLLKAGATVDTEGDVHLDSFRQASERGIDALANLVLYLGVRKRWPFQRID